jgi:hypothetical protein
MTMIKNVFLAIAEKDDGEVIYGCVYDTFLEAEEGGREMCRDLNTHMGWDCRPHVQDLEYIPSKA